MSSASDPDSAVDVSLPFTFYKTLKQRAIFNALLWKLGMRNRDSPITDWFLKIEGYHWVMWLSIRNNLSFTI